MSSNDNVEDSPSSRTKSALKVQGSAGKLAASPRMVPADGPRGKSARRGWGPGSLQENVGKVNAERAFFNGQ